MSQTCCILTSNNNLGFNLSNDVSYFVNKTFHNSNSGLQSSFPFTDSYFGREVLRMLGGTISSTPGYQFGLDYNIKDQIGDMFRIYEQGGWVSTFNGLPCFGGPGFVDDGNGVPEILAYWNFQDQQCFRTADAHAGGPVTLTDLTANGYDASMAAGSAGIGEENIYSQIANLGAPYMAGIDWAQGSQGQGNNYATVANSINIGSDVLIIFYAGERTTNTTSTAVKVYLGCSTWWG